MGKSPLSTLFTAPSDVDYRNERETPLGTMKILSGDYLLGELAFGNPWNLACHRSPGGEWLAFSNYSTSALSKIYPY